MAGRVWGRETINGANSYVIGYFKKYYAIALVLALVAPLWLRVVSDNRAGQMKDALIWTGVLLGCWLLVTKHPGFRLRGTWRKPTPAEAKLYIRLLLGVLLIDFGSKALFFRWDRPQQIELFKNFGLHSVFHPTAFEPFHLVLLLYFAYIFLLGALFFRFSNKAFDWAWLLSSPLALGGAIALFGERFMFGGVHNSFYFAGPLMWLCPTCASPHFSSYAWTPADFFVHAAIAPLLILAAAIFFPARPSIDEVDAQAQSV